MFPEACYPDGNFGFVPSRGRVAGGEGLPIQPRHAVPPSGDTLHDEQSICLVRSIVFFNMSGEHIDSAERVYDDVTYDLSRP